MVSIIIAVAAMSATGGLVTMIRNVKPTREERESLIQQQFRARKVKDIAAKAADEILDAITVVSNGDGEAAADDDGTEGAANPQ